MAKTTTQEKTTNTDANGLKSSCPRGSKLHQTAQAFAIKLCAYAVMSNHYHVVLHLRPDLSTAWSDREVVERRHLLFRGNLISQCYLANDILLDTQRERLKEDIALWRKRLTSPSWYMPLLIWMSQ